MQSEPQKKMRKMQRLSVCTPSAYTGYPIKVLVYDKTRIYVLVETAYF